MEHGDRDGTATTTPAPSDTASGLEQRLLAWQESGDHVNLESLVATILSLAEHVARATLHRLEGKSQAAVSHVLDVCEGTVSRLRMRAIAMLRDLLTE